MLCLEYHPVPTRIDDSQKQGMCLHCQECAEVNVCLFMWFWLLVLSSSLSVSLKNDCSCHALIWQMLPHDTSKKGFQFCQFLACDSFLGSQKAFGVSFFAFKTAINRNGSDLIFDEYLSCMAIISGIREAKMEQVRTHKLRMLIREG